MLIKIKNKYTTASVCLCGVVSLPFKTNYFYFGFIFYLLRNYFPTMHVS